MSSPRGFPLRAAVKQAAAVFLNRSGARSAIAAMRRRKAGGRRVLVFGYHRVCDDFESARAGAIESCLISRATFRRHVAFLADRFELVTMTRAVEILSGRARSSRDVAAITFDDGYADVLRNALPVLDEAGAPATIYACSEVVAKGRHFPHDRLFPLLVRWQQAGETGRWRATPFVREILGRVGAGGPRSWLHDLIAQRTPGELERLIEELSALMPAPPPPAATALDWDGIRALAQAGWDIGAHTTGHFVLTRLGAPETERDLGACRAAIEAQTRRRTVHFAYCNGYYNAAVVAALRRSGFASAVTTEDRLNVLGDDPYRIARRVLWEKSAAGATAAVSYSLLACQLDDAWTAIGFDASEPGRQPDLAAQVHPPALRRPA